MSLYNKIIDLQKLHQAWKKVHTNHPAAGVDHITVDIFEKNLSDNLQQLNIELKNHRYNPFPVKKTVLYQGEKAREIALYCVRDKVLQQSIATELNRIYNPLFTRSTYAYRPDMSARLAIEEIEKKIQPKAYTHIMKIDISHFFDTIQWNALENILKKNIHEEDVMELIKANSITPYLDEDGDITEKKQGIHQGSALSPVLSNIYLMDFDQWMEQQNVFYIRYSDDMIALGKDRESLMNLLSQIQLRLNQKGLRINEKKSHCVSLEDGVIFLGYHICNNGKAVPAKAEENLKDRLEMMWLTSGNLSVKEKIKKSLEIITGWEQYFTKERRQLTIFEYVTMVDASLNKEAFLEQLKQTRYSVKNIYRDIMEYLAALWQRLKEPELELFEYEQFFQILEEQEMVTVDFSEEKEAFLSELLLNYRKLLVQKSEDTMNELMQLYTDLHQYNKASKWMEQKNHWQRKGKTVPVLQLNENAQCFTYEKQTAAKLLRTFAAREDIFSLETLQYGQSRKSELQMLPLTEDQLWKHLSGEIVVGTYIQRSNSTVKHIVVDVDISKKILLQHPRNSDIWKEYLKKALNYCLELQRILSHMGIQAYIEYSGNRGYHVWVILTEWIPVRYANMFCDILEKQMEACSQEGTAGDHFCSQNGTAERNFCSQDGISVEYFPNKTRIKPGKYGQVMKIPYGVHVKTGERSYFLDETGNALYNINAFLDSISKTSFTAIKKCIAANNNMEEKNNTREMEKDMTPFLNVSDNAVEVLKRCNLMYYLCRKAFQTNYLTHFERLSILYVFGHLGEEGKQFVHHIMSFTLNYQYNVTEKFIRKMPDKPISCVKLRDQYKQITAEYGCSCSFTKAKNCYPSPVLHAVSDAKEVQADINLPISKSVTKDKKLELIEEINIHKKVQDLAVKILDLKKQKRKLDNSVGKVEKELERIYDNAKIDSLEIEMGLLVRREKAGGYEWLIEI